MDVTFSLGQFLVFELQFNSYIYLELLGKEVLMFEWGRDKLFSHQEIDDIKRHMAADRTKS